MSNMQGTLSHTVIPLPSGGKVLVLDTGARITPEAEAMLQALHSRSVGGVESHLKVLAEKGAEKFMATYYVGYGHKSIGDCGTVTVFIEGVSMLAAKAIQDWRLYAGQESSTRYVDFTAQPFKNPEGGSRGASILEAWRLFYLEGVYTLPAVLRQRYPRAETEKESVYEKAIAARAFDIMRSFLPAGATTNLACHMSLRQYADLLMYLRHHPLPEVREVAGAIESALRARFPSSFGDVRFPRTEEYNGSWMRDGYYFDDPHPVPFELSADGIDRTLLSSYESVLRNRPPKTELPRAIAESGTMQFRFLLDFGSFRDVHRHRAVVQRMPLLTMKYGFHEWYLRELPQGMREKALGLIEHEHRELEELSLPPEVAQYYIAMGFLTTCRLTGDLHALTYLAELRSTRFVHPTLRERARQVAGVLIRELGSYGLTLHLDEEPDRFDVRRGEQDIVRVL